MDRRPDNDASCPVLVILEIPGGNVSIFLWPTVVAVARLVVFLLLYSTGRHGTVASLIGHICYNICSLGAWRRRRVTTTPTPYDVVTVMLTFVVVVDLDLSSLSRCDDHHLVNGWISRHRILNGILLSISQSAGLWRDGDDDDVLLLLACGVWRI